MIGPDTVLVSYTKGAWTVAQMYLVDYARFGIFEWDEATYFWAHGEADKIEQYKCSLLTLHFHKPEDPSAHWLAPENTHLSCSPDQPILTAVGDWKPAGELKVGDKLQHFCGNGHTAVIDKIDPLVEDFGYDLVALHFGNYTAAGIILKGRTDARREPTVLAENRDDVPGAVHGDFCR